MLLVSDLDLKFRAQRRGQGANEAPDAALCLMTNTKNKSPFWLPGGHAQTLWSYGLGRAMKRPVFHRERWETPDQDFIDVDWLSAAQDRPLLVLFHGLEGSSSSHYVKAMSTVAQAEGWRFAVPHYRGCSGEPNRYRRFYHSGDTTEIDWLVQRFHAIASGAPLWLMGVSIGGNMLLSWAGQYAERARLLATAVAAVSVPTQLAEACDALSQGPSKWLYTRHFLRTLTAKCEAKRGCFSDLVDWSALYQVRTLREFDDLVTAPLHGFAHAADYYQRASCAQWLSAIAVPSLLWCARNDPFVPASTLPDRGQVSSAMTLDYSSQGGHVGFVSGAFPGQLLPFAQRIAQFFKCHCH